jgi:hypothetical protein
MKNTIFIISSGFRFVMIVLAIIFFSSCITQAIKRELHNTSEVSSLNKDLKYMKAHMKDGTVYLFSNWSFDRKNETITGFGRYLDTNRRLIEERRLNENMLSSQPKFVLNIDQIALLETNDPGPSLAGGLAVVTGVTAALTLFCLTNPKACFGSCPTFYAHDGEEMTLMAEGFSKSVSPKLEANDIDMLYHAIPSELFKLKLTNEALETHSIRQANLLIFEKREGERVFVSPDGRFYKVNSVNSPLKWSAPENADIGIILCADGKEYFSSADPNNLNAKEEIILTFSSLDSSSKGLVIGKRQTMMTTYLMYQGLAYMGNSTTFWMARLENGKYKSGRNIFDILGGIEVYQKDKNGKWVYTGEIHETGPIASDFSIIPLHSVMGDKLEVKLVMNRGLWRVDFLGLAIIDNEVYPDVISPKKVEVVHGSDTDPITSLLDENKYLVTYPGDEYHIFYNLPHTNCELFLDSKGYYLEWMRSEWVEEQSLRNFRLMAKRPDKFLRRVAPAYSKLEPTMEETFWNSRYVKN